MNWGLAAVVVLALAGAGGLLWWRRRVSQELALMNATATSKAAEVARLAPGTVAEVKGVLRCAAPLTAEQSKEICVYYKSEITRETTYYQTNSQGKRERKTSTSTIQSNTRFAPCVIEDDSGTVAVSLDGAKVEGKQVVNRREDEAKSLASTVMTIAIGGSDHSELIYTETILTGDIPIYALGEVQADRSIGKPASGSKNKIFVVSQKSEEERGKDLRSTMLWILVGAIVLFAIAAGCAIYAIMHRAV
ncbi:MAG: hypothetical protein QOI12_1450 [Alphaproteobacteria bacterium]|nr:hypothetical protein [Alphaproteobacteria bacterium]